jgi:hypothetical protein
VEQAFRPAAFDLRNPALAAEVSLRGVNENSDALESHLSG